jgi:trk system potassium uptake protein TrkH
MNRLIYPIRFSVVSKFFGKLCIFLALMNVVPFCTSMIFNERLVALRYAAILIIYLATGIILSRRNCPENMQANEGAVISVLTFIFTCLITTYPLMAKGLSFIDAFLEVVSCITSTGLSTIQSIDGAPRSFIFERSWMSWYGSLGFITLATIIIMQPTSSTSVLANTELDSEDLLAGAKINAYRIVLAYCSLTIIGILGCWALGLPFFYAFVYSVSGISTNGFTPTDGGLSSLAASLQLWIQLLCIFGAIPLTVYTRYLNKNPYFNFDILQVKTFIFVCLFFSLAITTCMHFISNINWIDALHKATAFIIQTQTTTGFTWFDYNKLDQGSKLLGLISMFLGGCTNSTAGGVKLLRLLIVLKMIKIALEKISSPSHAISETKLAGIPIKDGSVITSFLLIFLFIIVIIVSWFIFLLNDYEPLNALFVVVSAISTSGLDTGIVNPLLETCLKLVLCFDMLFGKLEVYAWLLILYPWTWFGSRMVEKA